MNSSNEQLRNLHTAIVPLVWRTNPPWKQHSNNGYNFQHRARGQSDNLQQLPAADPNSIVCDTGHRDNVTADTVTPDTVTRGKEFPARPEPTNPNISAADPNSITLNSAANPNSIVDSVEGPRGTVDG